MRTSIFAIIAVAFAGAAVAEGHGADQCFDKGTLKYFDCPHEEVVEVVEPMGAFYVGARFGFTEPEEYDINGGGNVYLTAEYGPVGALMAGYEFQLSEGLSLRPELEINYGRVDLDDFERGGAVIGDAGGSLSSLSGLFNLYGDLALDRDLDLILGGGLGVARLMPDDVTNNGAVVNSQDETAFTFHLDAGLGYDVTEQVTLEAMYRYTRIGDFAPAVGGQSEALGTHSGFVGARYKF